MFEAAPIADGGRVDQVLLRVLPRLEEILERYLPRLLVRGLTEFLVFGIKQAWACLFGGLLLVAMMVTGVWYPAEAPLGRYDFLFLYAIGVQVIFLISGLERWPEARVILIFHLVGTAMEVFKTAQGSWAYPEASLFRLGGVPLFSGFMYGAVGSYLARVQRNFDFRFEGYPALPGTVLLALLIYVNFFSHHYLPDFRLVLFGGVFVLFMGTRVHYRFWRADHKMPLLFGFFLVALFIWLAENIATLSAVWLYPGQEDGWHLVSFDKIGAWYLLMIISWVLVTLVHRPRRMLGGA